MSSQPIFAESATTFAGHFYETGMKPQPEIAKILELEFTPLMHFSDSFRELCMSHSPLPHDRDCSTYFGIGPNHYLWPYADHVHKAFFRNVQAALDKISPPNDKEAFVVFFRKIFKKGIYARFIKDFMAQYRLNTRPSKAGQIYEAFSFALNVHVPYACFYTDDGGFLKSPVSNLGNNGESTKFVLENCDLESVAFGIKYGDYNLMLNVLEGIEKDEPLFPPAEVVNRSFAYSFGPIELIEDYRPGDEHKRGNKISMRAITLLSRNANVLNEFFEAIRATFYKPYLADVMDIIAKKFPNLGPVCFGASTVQASVATLKEASVATLKEANNLEQFMIFRHHFGDNDIELIQAACRNNEEYKYQAEALDAMMAKDPMIEDILRGMAKITYLTSGQIAAADAKLAEFADEEIRAIMSQKIEIWENDVDNLVRSNRLLHMAGKYFLASKPPNEIRKKCEDIPCLKAISQYWSN